MFADSRSSVTLTQDKLKENQPEHITLKLLKTKDKEKILETKQRKMTHSTQRNKR